MLVVGLTGGIVSGKTTVAAFFKDLGGKIIDADVIAHQIIEPNQRTWKKIIRHFGRKILKDNQQIDRKKLAKIVFSEEDKLNLLNQITHPEIISQIKKKINRIKDQSNRDLICIIDVPLLFESNMQDLMDKIIVVYLDREEQIKRLCRRDGLSREEAIRRIDAQIPMNKKICWADYVIDNRLTIEKLKEQVIQIWKELNRILYQLE